MHEDSSTGICLAVSKPHVTAHTSADGIFWNRTRGPFVMFSFDQESTWHATCRLNVGYHCKILNYLEIAVTKKDGPLQVLKSSDQGNTWDVAITVGGERVENKSQATTGGTCRVCGAHDEYAERGPDGRVTCWQCCG